MNSDLDQSNSDVSSHYTECALLVIFMLNIDISVLHNQVNIVLHSLMKEMKRRYLNDFLETCLRFPVMRVEKGAVTWSNFHIYLDLFLEHIIRHSSLCWPLV